MNCSICLDDSLDSFVQLNCKHFFHKNCFFEWILHNGYTTPCPFCRHEITTLDNTLSVADFISFLSTYSTHLNEESINNVNEILRFYFHVQNITLRYTEPDIESGGVVIESLRNSSTRSRCCTQSHFNVAIIIIFTILYLYFFMWLNDTSAFA